MFWDLFIVPVWAGLSCVYWEGLYLWPRWAGPFLCLFFGLVIVLGPSLGMVFIVAIVWYGLYCAYVGMVFMCIVGWDLLFDSWEVISLCILEDGILWCIVGMVFIVYSWDGIYCV